MSEALEAIAQWEQGGEAACLSTVAAHISGYPQAVALDALTRDLQVLVLSLVSSSKSRLSVDALVRFMVSLLAALPSSSSQDPRNTLNDILLDVIWTVDVGLEDSLPSVPKAELPEAARATYDEDRRTLAAFVNALVTRSVISGDLCRQTLEVSLLGLAGLLEDSALFERRAVRVRTAVNYKQTNYNLLREQSEGYSKLVTEVVSMIGPPHDATTGYPAEPNDTIQLRAKRAWDNVVGLIGYFDLNANRVLDVLIDIFAGHTITHYAFFLELIRLTPWVLPGSESQYDRQPRGVVPAPVQGQYEGLGLDDVLRIAEKGGDIPDDPQAPTTCVLGQMIGFKFAQSQQDQGDQRLSPRKLYFATALLVREGLVSLEDVYPHLSPSDAEMEQVLLKHQAKMKEKSIAAQTSGGPSMGDAAPLRDAGPTFRSSATSKGRAADTTPNKSSTPTAREPLKQKLNILRTLISMGALRPALFILSKYEWMPDAHPEVADQLLCIVRQCLAPLCGAQSPSEELLRAKNEPVTDRIIVEIGFGPTTVPKRYQPTATFPEPAATHSTEFTYFYPAWSDTLPLCTTRREIFSVIEPLLRFTGVQCFRDIELLSQLCRIGRSELSQIRDGKETGTTKDQWRDLLRRYMLPALSMTRASTSFNMEVWHLLEFFDQQERWGLYGEWARAHTVHLDLKVRHVEITREVRSILRRVTSNGTNRLALPLAKLAHSNPCIVFTECVKQAMSYDNLIEAIAESARSLTPLGYDVLVYSILTAFSNSAKPRMKEDGTSVALWLQSLSTYTATIYKKFGGSADPVPVLEYVAHRLKNFRSSDLIILRELLARTTGIHTQANLTDDQVISMGGGPALRIEATASETRGSGSHAVAASHELGTKRLLEALNKADLLVPMIVLIAQQREFCIERVDRSEEYLKHISNLYDDCQAALFQYADFLITALGSKYPSILPPLEELCEKMAVKPDLVFHLYRPALSEAVMAQVISFSEEKSLKEKASREEKERLLKLQLTAKRAASTAAASEDEKPAANGDAGTPEASSGDSADVMVVDGASAKTETDISITPTAAPEVKTQPWVPHLLPLIESAKKILPPKALRVLSPGFYATFWQMSMWDLSPPALKKIYEREASRMRSLTLAAPSKSSRSIERHVMTVYRNILEEKNICLRIQKATSDRLDAEKGHWFRKTAATYALAQQLALTCFFPRSLLSPTDAEFVARFMKTLHEIGTPGYSSIASYANLFGAHLGDMIFSLSEHQTQNFGRLYRIVLEDLDTFAGDENQFRGGKPDSTPALPGFQRRFTVKDNVTYESLLTAADFRKALSGWRDKLFSVMLQLLESGTYIGVRNAIIFLSLISTRFPRRANQGERIITVLERLASTEKRPDLQVLLKSYSATVKNRRSTWEQEAPRETAKSRNPVVPDGPARVSTPTPAPVAAPTPKPSDAATSTIAAPVPKPTARPLEAAPTMPMEIDSNNGSHAMSISTISATSFQGPSALDSVEKPAVIKRINRANGTGPDVSRSDTPDAGLLKPEATILNIPPTSTLPPRPKTSNLPSSPRRSDVSPSPRHVVSQEDAFARRKSDMPPPTAPSSTPSATGLRTQQTTSDAITEPSDRRDQASRPRTPTEPNRRGRNKSPTSPHSSSRSRPTSPARSEGRRQSTGADNKDRSGRDDDRRGARIAGAADRERKERDIRGAAKAETAKERDTRERADRERERDRERDQREHRERGGAERHRDSDRDRERDRGRDGREQRDSDRDRARGPDRPSQRDAYRDGISGRHGNEKELTRSSSRRDLGRSAEEPIDRDRGRGSQEDNPHKRRRDEELPQQDPDSSKRRRANEGSSYVPGPDKDRENGNGGRSDRPHERGTRRDRNNNDGPRSLGSGSDNPDKRDQRRDKREREQDKTNGNGTRHDDDSRNAEPSSPAGRPTPTGPRSERDRGGRFSGNDEPSQSLVDRLGPASSRGDHNASEAPSPSSRRAAERERGRRKHSPANGDHVSTPPASGEAEGASAPKKRSMFEQAMGNAVGGGATNKRVKIDRTRRKGKDAV